MHDEFDEETEKLEALYTAARDAKWCLHFGKQSVSSPESKT